MQVVDEILHTIERPNQIRRVLGFLPGGEDPGFRLGTEFRFGFEAKRDAAGLRHLGKKQPDSRGGIQTQIGENIIGSFLETSINADLEFYGVAHGLNVSIITPRAIQMEQFWNMFFLDDRAGGIGTILRAGT